LRFSLVVQFLYPTVFVRWFNKFSPLEDASLRSRIEGLLAKCGFRSRGLFVMDGSKRSSHGNAYFTGFGAAKRIVLFDTLISRLAPPEIEAGARPRAGHFSRHHVWKRMALVFGASLAFLWLLGWLIGQDWFYAALGVRSRSAAMALVLFFMVAPVFTFLLQPLASWYSRVHEFEADAYAARVCRPPQPCARPGQALRGQRGNAPLRTLCIRLFTTRTRRRCCASRGCKPNRLRRRNMSTLAGKKCRPLPAGTPALTRARIDALLAEVPGWTYDGRSSRRAGRSRTTTKPSRS